MREVNKYIFVICMLFQFASINRTSKTLTNLRRLLPCGYMWLCTYFVIHHDRQSEK